MTSEGFAPPPYRTVRTPAGSGEGFLAVINDDDEGELWIDEDH